MNCMNSCDIVSIATAISCAIAKCASKEDLPIIAAVISQIGSTLATIIVAEEANKPFENAPEGVSEISPGSGIITAPFNSNP